MSLLIRAMDTTGKIEFADTVHTGISDSDACNDQVSLALNNR